jgi:hypothetical protein
MKRKRKKMEGKKTQVGVGSAKIRIPTTIVGSANFLSNL